MFLDGLLNFSGLNGETVVVDSSAEVTRFPNVLFTYFAAGKIDGVVCDIRYVPQYFVGTTLLHKRHLNKF